MPVPSTLADLSVTAASNSPSGADAPSVLDDHLRAHASFLAYLRNSQQLTTEATVASAATVDLGAQTSYAVHITGTTTITSFGSSYQGPRFLRFSGALTLTHNGTSLILPGNANITTAAGDSCIAIPYASGWRVVHYQRASVVPPGSIGSFISSSGWAPMTGGLVLQWGTATISGALQGLISFPIAFPNGALSAVVSDVKANTGDTVILGLGSTLTATQMGVVANGGGLTEIGSFRWIAIGY